MTEKVYENPRSHDTPEPVPVHGDLNNKEAEDAEEQAVDTLAMPGRTESRRKQATWRKQSSQPLQWRSNRQRRKRYKPLHPHPRFGSSHTLSDPHEQGDLILEKLIADQTFEFLIQTAGEITILDCANFFDHQVFYPLGVEFTWRHLSCIERCFESWLEKQERQAYRKRQDMVRAEHSAKKKCQRMAVRAKDKWEEMQYANKTSTKQLPSYPSQSARQQPSAGHVPVSYGHGHIQALPSIASGMSNASVEAMLCIALLISCSLAAPQ